jgi:HK97 family phage prohead protease
VKLKFLNLSLQNVKAAELQDDGTFEGYASVFGEVDSYGEVVKKGAFKASLKAWAKRGKLPAMLWQHDSKNVIGKWLEMKEDDIGLRVKGQIALSVPQGAAAYALIKMDAVDGLSIGFVATEWTTDSKSDLVTLDVIDLWEVSIVTFPAGSSARVDGVKAIAEYGKLPTVREFEAALGELGFSNSRAEIIVSKGYAYLLRQRDSAAQASDAKTILDGLVETIRSTPRKSP